MAKADWQELYKWNLSARFHEITIRTGLVSSGCHNNVPQTGEPKIAGRYCLIVLEARSVESRCWHIPSEACVGTLPCLCVASGSLLMVPGIPSVTTT